MKRVTASTINHLKTLFKNIKKRFSNPRTKNFVSLDNIAEKVQADLLSIASLDKDQKRIMNDDVKKMISYYNQLTDQIESRRTRLIESSWQTLTILIAASGLLIAAKPSIFILFPILCIFGIQIVFAIAKLHEYQVQSSYKYPFNNSDYGNKWKWFYHANPFIKEINPDPFQNENKNRQNLTPYLEGLHFFLENYEKETVDKELQNNIQQLYLLQVHNFYKNKFFLRLNYYDKRANQISFGLISGFLGLYLGYWLYSLIW